MILSLFLICFSLDDQQQVGDARVQLQGDLSKRGQALILWAFDFYRIREAPVDLLRIAREDRAGFTHTVADGDDLIEILPQELLQTF